ESFRPRYHTADSPGDYERQIPVHLCPQREDHHSERPSHAEGAGTVRGREEDCRGESHRSGGRKQGNQRIGYQTQELTDEAKGESKMSKNTAVFGIYPTQGSVESSVDALKTAGFRNTDISVLFPENVGSKDFAVKKGTKAPEGASAGAGIGAVLGGGLGWLVGIGALAIPGLGPFIAAGPIVAAIAGAGVGGAVGGITGALIGMGIPEYEAKRYEGRVKDGGILLSVHSDSSEWTKKAKEILERTGAQDIASTGEANSDQGKSDKPVRHEVA